MIFRPSWTCSPPISVLVHMCFCWDSRGRLNEVVTRVRGEDGPFPGRGFQTKGTLVSEGGDVFPFIKGDPKFHRSTIRRSQRLCWYTCQQWSFSSDEPRFDRTEQKVILQRREFEKDPFTPTEAFLIIITLLTPSLSRVNWLRVERKSEVWRE